MASDERILGSGDFIEQVLSEAEEKAKQTLGWKGRVPDLQTLLSKISKKEGVEGQKVRGGIGGDRWWEQGKYFVSWL